MPTIIERAVPADAEALVKAMVAAFHHDTVLYGVPEDGPPGYQSVEVMLEKITTRDTFTIRCGGEVVGGMVVFDRGEGARHLDLIFLSPEYHGQGIGSQAMCFLDEQYPTATYWTLDTPSWAVRNQYFYGKFGFIKTGEHPFDGITLFSYERTR
ncbi:MAG: GNAT family N-acetyltransferase [Anaerolineae bacterium]|jgi:GNAT superfamily N-acetyltransferase|nr:GNAT family N-acetyltransferase [Anaerolineae bacterium]